MPLTFRQNGSGSQNLVTAQWWNDYYNLLTGQMKDQSVAIASSLSMNASVIKPAGPALTAVTGSGLGVGSYSYGFTYVDGNGMEAPISGLSSVTTTSSNAQVQATLSTGPGGTVTRNIYRTKVSSGQLYFLQTINDNVTTTFTDSAADTSLTTIAPTDFSQGGIQFRDANGFVQGWITQTSGRIGISTLHNLQVQAPHGNLVAQFDQSGVSMNGDLTLNTGSIILAPENGGTYKFYIKNGTVPYVTTGNSGFGVKSLSGPPLMEIKTNGDLIIVGRYMTSASNFTTLAGQSFDSFDYAEIYECDQTQANGTVVCPGPGNKMVKCTHDNCHAACFISYKPGFQIGEENHEKGVHPIALVGRVNAKTAYDISARTLVVSDGRGGVRALQAGEWGFALGFALNESMNGQVGIFIRPMYCKGQ